MRSTQIRRGPSDVGSDGLHGGRRLQAAGDVTVASGGAAAG